DPAAAMIIGTTRTDGVQDDGIVDMGYHYPGLTGSILAVSPGSLSFPETTIIDTSSLPLTLYNVGIADLWVWAATSTQPAFSTDFPVGDTLVIAPQDSSAISVSFAPDSVGLFSGVLVISSNGGSASVPLSGIGVEIPSPLTITLTPLHPPIVIPPGGGYFDYLIEIVNVSAQVQTTDVWCNVQVPGGSQFTVLGPVELTMNPGYVINRTRRQEVPANAPSGDYVYRGFLGDHPWRVLTSDSFTFVKQGATTDWFGSEGWFCTGESFPVESIEGAQPCAPTEFVLHPCAPNPFNPITILRFDLPQAAQVKLEVFDVNGRMVGAIHELPLRQWYPAGTHEIPFDGSNLPSGIYFARLRAGNYTAVQKLVLMK
ncbi:MAG: T9SS type A sorting domain-containing protein, partial [bacterium]